MEIVLYWELPELPTLNLFSLISFGHTHALGYEWNPELFDGSGIDRDAQFEETFVVMAPFFSAEPQFPNGSETELACMPPFSTATKEFGNVNTCPAVISPRKKSLYTFPNNWLLSGKTSVCCVLAILTIASLLWLIIFSFPLRGNLELLTLFRALLNFTKLPAVLFRFSVENAIPQEEGGGGQWRFSSTSSNV